MPLRIYIQCRPLLAGLLVLALFAPLTSPSVNAQATFSPDRPGLGNGASIVPTGHVMIELGLPALEQRRYASSVRGWSSSFPALLRVGVSRRVELRLGSPVYHVFRAEGFEDAEGLSDLELGAKIALPVERPFFVTSIALLPTLSIPVSDNQFASDGIGGSLSAVGNWLGWWAIGFNTTSGIALVPVGDAYRVGGQFAVSAFHSPVPWLTLFAETAYYPTRDLSDSAYAGAGFTVTPLPNLQLDAYVDAGLNDASADFLYGAGIAFQL